MDGFLEAYSSYNPVELIPQQQSTFQQGQKRIEFSRSTYKFAHFGLIASGCASAVLIFRLIPALSFGSFALKVIAFAVIGRDAIFGESEVERLGYQKALAAMSLGSIAGEWDAIWAIIGAVGDFLTIYGGSIIVGLVMIAILAFWLIGGRQNAN
ncbi:hypothetical protein QUB68_28275 [Microcoleus sp. A006_D1]|uniref:hypothetical protein n=1 Tax=Microcoleus sp. A006_D1 TaxID=3055267 RepID=UPI002FD43017